MKLTILFTIFSLSLISSQAEPLVWKDLFNGKDLSNWVDVNTSPETWWFEDGLLKCKGLPIGVMRSEKQYENFVLEIEWRHMENGGNSGVFIWSEGRPAPDKELPKGMEVQMLELSYSKMHNRHPGYVSGELFGANGLRKFQIIRVSDCSRLPQARPSPHNSSQKMALDRTRNANLLCTAGKHLFQ